MATDRQKLGNFGEETVARRVLCPNCKADGRTFRLLPTNFKCADLICDFCGYLAQVKSVTVSDIDTLPRNILGAAWQPQKQRMDASIYFPLFIVLVQSRRNFAIYFLPKELQTKEMFIPRNPLKQTARRAGWQGYTIDLSRALGEPVRIEADKVSVSVI